MLKLSAHNNYVKLLALKWMRIMV